MLAILDFRRGFLFASYTARSPYYAFRPGQLALLAVGFAGAVVSFRSLRTVQPAAREAARDVQAATFLLLALLIIDLFGYRGVPAARSIAAGAVGVDWLNAFGVGGVWRPFAQATSYLLNVWHATLLGILISGLALTSLPRYIAPYFARSGFTGSLFGALFALPQPFCSCCSSVMAPSFARRGASTNFVLSFVVGAPMLNVTTMILAVALLPAPFALMRIAAGVIVAVIVTYAVSRAAERWDRPSVVVAVEERRRGVMQWALGSYFRLFDLDRLAPPRAIDTPADLIAAWLRASARIGLVLVPTLWVWSVAGAALFQLLPSAFGNNLPSVLLSAVAGTFFMISTWSEIPMALQLIRAGFSGPAAALLVVLPAISLPCMMLLGGSLQRFRLVALLSVAVMIVGVVAGVIFL